MILTSGTQRAMRTAFVVVAMRRGEQWAHFPKNRESFSTQRSSCSGQKMSYWHWPGIQLPLASRRKLLHFFDIQCQSCTQISLGKPVSFGGIQTLVCVEPIPNKLQSQRVEAHLQSSLPQNAPSGNGGPTLGSQKYVSPGMRNVHVLPMRHCAVAPSVRDPHFSPMPPIGSVISSSHHRSVVTTWGSRHAVLCS